MCGIVGYIGFNQASDFLLDGMAKLEYRGYDSAGIAVIGPENVIKIQKKVGRLANLEAIVKADPNSTFLLHNLRHTSHKTTFSPSPYNPEPSYPADANDGPLSLPGQARCIAAGFSQRQSSGHVQTTVVVRHCPAEVLTGIHRTHSTKRPGGCASLLLSP